MARRTLAAPGRALQTVRFWRARNGTCPGRNRPGLRPRAARRRGASPAGLPAAGSGVGHPSPLGASPPPRVPSLAGAAHAMPVPGKRVVGPFGEAAGEGNPEDPTEAAALRQDVQEPLQGSRSRPRRAVGGDDLNRGVERLGGNPGKAVLHARALRGHDLQGSVDVPPPQRFHEAPTHPAGSVEYDGVARSDPDSLPAACRRGAAHCRPGPLHAHRMPEH